MVPEAGTCGWIGEAWSEGERELENWERRSRMKVECGRKVSSHTI